MPDMEYVASTNVEAVGYDAAARELHVRFLSGETYVYRDVDEYIFHDLLNAPSKGSYINRTLKGGGYTYYKL